MDIVIVAILIPFSTTLPDLARFSRFGSIRGRTLAAFINGLARDFLLEIIVHASVFQQFRLDVDELLVNVLDIATLSIAVGQERIDVITVSEPVVLVFQVN